MQVLSFTMACSVATLQFNKNEHIDLLDGSDIGGFALWGVH